MSFSLSPPSPSPRDRLGGLPKRSYTGVIDTIRSDSAYITEDNNKYAVYVKFGREEQDRMPWFRNGERVEFDMTHGGRNGREARNIQKIGAGDRSRSRERDRDRSSRTRERDERKRPRSRSPASIKSRIGVRLESNDLKAISKTIDASEDLESPAKKSKNGEVEILNAGEADSIELGTDEDTLVSQESEVYKILDSGVSGGWFGTF